MGNGIAHVFAQFGNTVTLIDQNQLALDKARQTITKNLERQVAKGAITPQVQDKTMANLSYNHQIDERLADVDLVVEAVVENIAVKQQIFTQLDALCKPSAILASNTSSIAITELASFTTRPDKVIGMHFMNPVPVMKLVEVIRGFSTSNETCASVKAISEELQKTPVEVNDYPGFISNRILMPMINEAIEAHWQGVGTVDAIDQVMKLGMAHPMGPLQLADYIGLDVCLYILKVLSDGFGQPKYAPCPLLVNMVRAGKLGAKSGEGFYDWEAGKAIRPSK